VELCAGNVTLAASAASAPAAEARVRIEFMTW
jgi:hypothetical protein